MDHIKTLVILNETGPIRQIDDDFAKVRRLRRCCFMEPAPEESEFVSFLVRITFCWCHRIRHYDYFNVMWQTIFQPACPICTGVPIRKQ